MLRENRSSVAPFEDLGSNGPPLSSTFSFCASDRENPNFIAEGSDYATKTLPSRGEKKRKTRNQRPKTGDIVYFQHSNEYADVYQRNVPTNGHDGYVPQHAARRDRRTRPKSMIERVDELSPRHTANCVSPSRVQSATSRPPPTMYNTKLGTSIKSLPDADQFVLPGRPETPNFYKSMPRIPSAGESFMPGDATNSQDYGIYGDDDSLNEESGYVPSILSVSTQDALSEKLAKLNLVSRSKSDGNILQHVDLNSSGGPSQQHITMSLAQSLANVDHPRNQPRPHTAASSRQNNPRPSALVNRSLPVPCNRPKSAPSRGRHVVFPSEEPPQSIRENVWEDTMVDSTLEMSMLNTTDTGTSKRKEFKKKKKEREKQRKLAASVGEEFDVGKEKKRGTLKDSIKNIFFKKR